ncbi:aspartic peptidase domain-containing protein [Plectosphaerella plurivora]|uniref:Aspartic peptidase domain-containing protein n=1 Tax=Plectosphaerella plurivora TaxID=936078 RepID=A0A9P9AIB6_9PEZI|nr:aspartic peptidase domain-containing protein [Plectosphaerella plurivora]
MRDAALRDAAAAALLAVALLTTPATSIGLPRAVQGDGFLSVPVHESRRKTAGLHKRDVIEAILANQEYFYTMDIEIGTPGQLVTVLLDTGSSDLWVNPNCSSIVSATEKSQCLSFGQYDPDASTTPALGPIGHKSIRFGDPSNPNTISKIEIDYYADNLALVGGHNKTEDDLPDTPRTIIANQTFGVVVGGAGQSQGILGLAPDLNAGFDGEQADQPYSLLLDSLVDQGLIGKRAFSLDLRHADSAEGAIVYGGLDRSKFIGTLEPVPLVDGIRGEPRLAIKMDAVTAVLPDAPSPKNRYVLEDSSRNVMLDSGTTLSRLHTNAAHAIFKALGATAQHDGYYLAPCSMRSLPVANASVDFDIANKTLRVPMSDFILELTPYYAEEDPPTADEKLCYVGLVVTADQQVLGDSILRAGYFVFDWDDRKVHIAQASNCGSELVAVKKGDDLASLTGRCEADWARADGNGTTTATGGGSGDDDAKPRATSTADPHQNNSSFGTETEAAPQATSTTSEDSGSSAGSLLSQLRTSTGPLHLSFILAFTAAFIIAS